MKVTVFLTHAVVIGILVLVCIGSSAAATMRQRPGNDTPIDNGPGSANTSPLLMGTTYKVSGFNSWLPSVNSPTSLKFDGEKEYVGAYSINESIERIVNDRGVRETWINFEFRRLYGLADPRSTYPLAKDAGSAWRVNLADLVLPSGATAPEYYMYFTNNGQPAPFNRRPPRGTPDLLPIGDHPYLDGISVIRGETFPLLPGDMPPGAMNALVTKFDHYFSGVHDVVRGLGVPAGVDGFHIGYRIAVPEPASCLYVMAVVLCGAWMRRRPRSN
jgi:hypothetical protein